MKKIFLISITMFFAISCANDPTKEPDYYNKIADAAGIKTDPTVIRASGYGVAVENPELSPMQIKLMAMRAAKVDAYRNLAERIYGTKVSGGSNLANLAAQNDRVKAYVNSIVKGAKLVANYELGGGGYESVLEVVIQPVLKRCITQEGVVADPYCINFLNSSDFSKDSYPGDETPKAPSKRQGDRYQVN